MTKRPFYIENGDPPAKQLILKEGLRLFATQGLSGTSIRDIAAASGYSNPALYKHFKTKEALAVTLFERSYKEQLSRLTLATNRESTFEKRFHAYLVTLAALFDAHPHAVILAADNLAQLWPHVSEDLKSRTIVTLTRELIQQGRREGLVAKDADLSLQVTLVLGMQGQMARQLYLGALEGPAKRYVKKIERILRAGLT